MIALVDLGIGALIIVIALLVYKAAIGLNKKDK